MWLNYLPLALPLIGVKKILNYISAESSYIRSNLTGKVHLRGMPSQLMVEPINSCNLRCPLCAYGSGNVERKATILNLNRYCEVIDELSPYLNQLLLWNQGEPFLHPQFLNMVHYAVEKGIFTLTSTNGHFLKRAEEIVSSGLHGLIISLDAAKEETYGEYRVGGDFNEVIAGVRKLADYKKQKHIRFPIIIMQMVVMKMNEEEVEDFMALARKCGANMVVYKTAEIINPGDRIKYQPARRKYRRYEEYNPLPVEKHCKKLWYQPVLFSDGTWGACCFDKSGKIPLGEKAKKAASVRDFWFSNEFMELRKKVYSERESIEECRNCSAHLKIIAGAKWLNSGKS